MDYFISSAASRSASIIDSVDSLVEMGYRNIELTGGSEWHDNLIEDLLNYNQDNDVKFLLHHYFPPAPEPFVINIASLNQDVHNYSTERIKLAIELSSKLGAEQYAIHAGYYKDITVREIGNPVEMTELYDKSAAYDTFCKSYIELSAYASDHGVKLYIENNVNSINNKKAYGDNTPVMLVCPEEYRELKADIDFPLLLDHAHLRVSCATLELDYHEACKELFPESDYWHISDNDGLTDTNDPLAPDGPILKELKNSSVKPNILTLEVYAEENELNSSIALIKRALDANTTD